jgi:Protein of unknown function (DUF2934)
MQDSAPQVDGRDHMEIARVAHQLWQQAGRPPGRFSEYWMKVERAVVEARDALILEATAVKPVQDCSSSISPGYSVKHEPQDGPGTKSQGNVQGIK